MKKEIVIAIILTLVAVIGAYFIGTEEKEKEYTGGFKTYTVIPGETLWSIAEDIESEKDIREIIYIIKKDNGMQDSNINAWQELKIRENY